jgi:alpha-N-arabinofuranosidase
MVGLALLLLAPVPASAPSCAVSVHAPTASSHRVSPLTMGCHSDTGYAHQSRALSAELLYGSAFEQVPDAPYVPPPPAGYACKWIGEFGVFNTAGGGPGDVEYATYDTDGRELSEEEKDASCCSRCDCAPGCEFWMRDTGSNKCSLRANFANFDNSSKTVRGNFRNASKGHCSIADPVVASGAGWLGFGGAQLDNTSSPVPRGLWAPASRSLKLGTKGAGATSRGFAGEGLFLEGGKRYEGYLVLKAEGAATVTVTLEPRGGGAPLATAEVQFGGGNWSEVPFMLTPNRATECVGLHFYEAQQQGISCQANGTYVDMAGGWGRNSAAPGGMSDTSAHVCVACGGQFTIRNAGDTTVSVGYASLTAGAWGRYRNTTARASSVEALEKMGVRMIRSGGSVACDPTMAWTDWRGKAWQRRSASSQGNWVHGLVSGWGLFEAIDLCNAMDDTTCVITLFGGMSGEDGHAARRCAEMEQTPPARDADGDRACDLSSEKYGDLVEYCYGNASTQWGQLRIKDGHPGIYNVTTFELGNEQYNANFAGQVAAMEARARTLGLPPKTLSYLWPQGPGDSPGRKDFAPTASDAAAINALGLGTNIMSDIHGPAMGGVPKAEQVFAEAATANWGAMNLETNCGDHTFHRALTEGRDLNQFFRFRNPALKGRAASFCMERSGYNEGFANDQGLSFSLPNTTWLQPPGWVHAMVSESWQPLAVNVSLSPGCASLNLSRGDISASASEDGRSVTVRVVNGGPAALALSVTMAGGGAAAVRYSTLEGSACAVDEFPYASEHRSPCANTPAQPTLFSPTPPRAATGPVTAAPYSYTVLTSILSSG